MRMILLLSLLFAALPARAAPVRLCVIGDSISARIHIFYTSPWLALPWSSHLKITHHPSENFEVLRNIAISGDNTVLQRTALDNELHGKGCTHAAFLIGTNDITVFTSDSAETVYGRINAMASIMETEPNNAAVLALSILARGADLTWTGAMEKKRRTINAALAARPGSHFIDGAAALTDSTSISTTAWASSTSYALGVTRQNGGRIYQAIVAGTSASSGGPTGTTSYAQDGNMVWQYLGTPWASSTAYVVGDRVVNGGKLYICSVAGTSAASGGPTGTLAEISDGSVSWTELPRLRPSTQGALHPDNDGQAIIAATVDAAARAAGLW